MTEAKDTDLTTIKSESTVGGRLARYGKVSGAMAGLAAKLAGEKYLGMTIERDKHAQEVLVALGGLKGPLMKVGQILATIPEALPPEYASALQELQSNAPSMGWSFVRRRMKTELGSGWRDNFGEFEKEAAAAASLGQVHRATTLDGVNVACKLQYPDMQSAIQADLNQLKILFSMYERYDKSIQTEHIHKELSERLSEELDYEREAKHTRLYGDILKDEAGVHVPEIISELSTSRLLTSTWMEGEQILNYKDSDIEVRNQLAMNMFRAWYVPLYHYGVVHGDPHLGNYSVREDHSINLLDFGCVRMFEGEFIQGVIDLYTAMMTKNNDLAVHAYETWGFKGLSKEQVETLNIWANFLYEPVMQDKIRTIGSAKGSVYGPETAKKVHEKLRDISKDSGSVQIPREFVFMDRAALGLGSVFIHLNAEVNWYRLFNELIDGFDVEVLKTKQTKMLEKHSLSAAL
jgi:predicted unusual protein kinase regulating ubiquinone biosynthesis (AarF/ABC1/UbiB family)